MAAGDEERRHEVQEILALLTARTGPLEVRDRTPSTFHGAEIAGLLARISEGAQLLAMVKYIGDESVMSRLIAFHSRQWEALAEEENWRLDPEEEMIRRLVWLALIEVIDEPRCRQCRGRRQIVKRTTILVCPRCHGSGREIFRGADYARTLGMSRQRWQTWAPRYGRVLRRMEGWAAYADSELRGKLRRELRG